MFFEALCLHTRQGMCSDPAYGGNRDRIGWEDIGFPGLESLASTNNRSCSAKAYFVQDYAWEDLIPFMREKGQVGDRRERNRAVGDPMKDRVVLITNVEHFVGRPVATELVTQGAAVVCHDKSFADAAEAKAFAAANPATHRRPCANAGRDRRARNRGPRQGRRCRLQRRGRRGPRAPIETASPDELRAALEDMVVLSVRDSQCGRAANEGAQARQDPVHHLGDALAGAAELLDVRDGARRH